MKTISPCTDPTFLVNPSPCSNPSALPFKATLSRHDVVANVALTVTQLPTGQLKLTLPTPFPLRGIWTLTVGTPTCCCFNARVFIDTCAPMTTDHKHIATPGNTATTPVPVCCP